jgi:hypothetical protein
MVLANESHCTGTTSVVRVVGYVGSVQWQESANGTNFTPITGSTKDTLHVQPTAVTYYRAIITSGPCASVVTNVVQMNITQGSDKGTLVVGNNPLCEGRKFVVSLVNSVGKVQWQTSSTGGSGTWTDIINATQTTYAYQSTVPDVNKYFRALVVSGTCPMAISDSVLAKFVPGAVAGTLIADADTFCINNATKITLNGYQGAIRWQQSGNGNLWSDTSVTQPVLNTGNLTKTKFYRVILKKGTCEDTTKIKQIQIYTNPIGGKVTALTPEICLGKIAKLRADSGTYLGRIQWQVSTDSINFSDVPKETSPTLVSTPQLQQYYRISTYFLGCAKAYSTYARVKVLPAAFAGVVRSSKTVRPNEDVTLRVENYIGKIQWQYASNGIDFTDLVGRTADTIHVRTDTVSYYRAKVTSIDCVDLSNIVRISVDFIPVEIFPVPATSKVTVRFNADEVQTATLKIYDMLGQLVREQQVNLVSGFNEVELGISDLSDGVHTIIIATNSRNVIGRFIKH